MTPIPYELKRRRGQRSIRVSVHPGGRLLVTSGLMMSVGEIERFLSRKSEWIQKAIDKMKVWQPGLLAKRDPEDYRMYKKDALRMIEERIKYFNETYQHRFTGISVKNHRHLWGSCSRQGRLNFNYKLIHLPQLLADYVIVHELCHLAVFNHSKKFWMEVEKTIPDWKKRRQELRKAGNGTLG
jgi:hypothetical protein